MGNSCCRHCFARSPPPETQCACLSPSVSPLPCCTSPPSPPNGSDSRAWSWSWPSARTAPQLPMACRCQYLLNTDVAGIIACSAHFPTTKLKVMTNMGQHVQRARRGSPSAGAGGEGHGSFPLSLSLQIEQQLSRVTPADSQYENGVKPCPIVVSSLTTLVPRAPPFFSSPSFFFLLLLFSLHRLRACANG